MVQHQQPNNKDLLDRLHLQHLQKIVVKNAKFLNLVISSGFWFTFLVVLAKIFRLREFSWTAINISLTHAWFIVLLFSIAHFYAGWLLINSVKELSKYKSDTKENAIFCIEAYYEIHENAHHLFRGMASKGDRTRSETKKISKDLFNLLGISYKFNELPSNEIQTYAILIAMFSLITAIIPWDIFNMSRNSQILFISVALIIVLFNWVVGSTWTSEILDFGQKIFSEIQNPK